MLDAIDETGFAASRRNIHSARGACPNVQHMETIMRKTALTTLGVLLISGLAVQIAAAAEQHRGKTHRDLSNIRGAYNQVNEPIVVAPRASDRFDLSRPGGSDPDLNPSGS